MAKFKFEAGAEFDILTHSELHHEVNSLLRKLGQGVRFRRIIDTVVADVNGDYTSDGVGPDAGFIWSLRWANSSDSHGPDLYINENTLLNHIGSTTANPVTFPSETFILYPGDKIVAEQVAGTVSNAHLQVQFQYGVVEVPVEHEFQLLG